MSLLNQSGEEQADCPLCMEPLEVDDLNFFPCACGYQICRFCWHRIRTDGNGLCPACRQPYSEDPADFIPLSQEQMAKLKSDKRQRDQQRKAKLHENRKHLASVRVVQRNLVFVVGLPMRLADQEVLKRHEYFGKFGKIHKVVINQSTTYAGSQGPSASAYVTYMKSDDALRAIQSVNNISIDGRVIKSSLGTTKYCSHFMKNQPCPKPDCMYLHDFGDPEASFTKEQMHIGKHQEYEKKLHEGLLQRTAAANNNTTNPQHNNNNNVATEKPTVKSKEQANITANSTNGGTNNKENWPQLEKDSKDKDKKVESNIKEKMKGNCSKSNNNRPGVKDNKKDNCKKHSECSSQINNIKIESNGKLDSKVKEDDKKMSILDDNSSFFSHNAFHKIVPERQDSDESPSDAPQSMLTDSLPDINTSEDWAAAFGFNKLEHTTQNHEVNQPDPPYYRLNTNEDFRSLFDVSKLQENILDALPNKNFGASKETPSYFGKDSGLDQHMSKFFMDFHQKNGQKEVYTNGLNGYNNGYYTNPDRLLLLQQKKLEEHLMNLSLRQNYGHNSNHFPNPQNGDLEQAQNGFGPFPGGMLQGAQIGKQSSRIHLEDELDFDPFQETQKAFAELMASEQNYKTHSAVRGNVPTGQMNGLVHNQGGKGHLPPPPPGFVQQTAHMNSFGSKILPFLNMSNSQQVNPNQNWPSYNSPLQQQQQQQQQQQHKNMNGCNDWKEFDSAIVTTSRHYPLNNLPPVRDHFASMPQQTGPSQQQIANGSLRPHEYTINNAFSNFTQHIQQPNYNGFPHSTATQQNLNWFASELTSQISSPPGFRNTNQTSKQQEC